MMTDHNMHAFPIDDEARATFSGGINVGMPFLAQRVVLASPGKNGGDKQLSVTNRDSVGSISMSPRGGAEREEDEKGS